MKRAIELVDSTERSEDGSTEEEDEDDDSTSDDNESIENSYTRNGSTPNDVKRLKTSFKDKALFKPPTADELNSLRETENLFHSSLFRLQSEELLKEINFKEKWKPRLNKFLNSIKADLQSSPESKQYKLSDRKLLKCVKVTVPFSKLPFEVKGVFKFIPPTSIKTIGSYPLDLTYGKTITVDLGIEIPKEFWQHSDHLNYCYHLKRATYLAYIANILQKNSEIDDLYFKYQHGDETRPVLVLVPDGKLGKHCLMNLIPLPALEFFKLNRFVPIRNNVRTSCFFENETFKDEVATPHYNQSILKDLTSLDHLEFLTEKLSDAQGVKDGILLLKVWLSKRNIDQGYYGFTGFMMTMLVIHLLQTKKISKMMSSYQVLRNTLLALSEAEWSSNGLQFGIRENNKLNLQSFHDTFDVVFVDEKGVNNYCANVSISTFDRVINEAKLGLRDLNESNADSFDALFVKPVPFISAFDFIFQLYNMEEIKNSVKGNDFKGSVLDYCGLKSTVALPKIMSVLKKGLNKRITLLDQERNPSLSWKLKEPPPQLDSLENVTIGVLLNQENCNNFLDKGPEADDPLATDFRTFWGEKSELRRFKDGIICESIVWTGVTTSDRREVMKTIISYILKKHFQLTSIKYCSGPLENVLKLPSLEISKDNLSYGTGEESLLSVAQSYNSLSKFLRNLNGLPLAITSVQGISPALRYTEVFSPIPTDFKQQIADIEKLCVKTPNYVYPIEVVLHMEGSGKWPDDVDAIRRVRVAFHIKIAELLKSQCFLTSAPFTTHVDVLKDGYVFRLFVASRKEITLLKQFQTTDGMIKNQETDESLALECKFESLPQLTSALHGLQQQHSTFSAACRLSKRWVSSQMLSLHFPEVCVELMVAHLFLNPAPFTVPGSPTVGLLRFLGLLIETNWQTTPLIVNLNDTFKGEEITEIQTWFTTNRPTLPPLCIVSPYDKKRSIWSKKDPSGPVLYHLTRLARVSINELQSQFKELNESDFKKIFRPPVNLYDLVIYLKPQHIPKHYMGIDFKNKTFNSTYEKSGNEFLPVIDYDPALCFLKELEATFDEVALFCYDCYGGEYIGLIWKPKALQQQPFKVSNINGRKLSDSNAEENPMLTPNIEGILEDISALGAGLVDRIKTKTNKWIV